jgi:hypothetical protein
VKAEGPREKNTGEKEEKEKNCIILAHRGEVCQSNR